MFNPSQQEVRRFFCAVFAKARVGAPMTPLELLTAQWLDEHLEYEADLADAANASTRAYVDAPNPFLHLSMHVSISEQCSIDQPRGIRQAVELLAARHNSLHVAHHEAMECLGQMMWESQRSGQPPDGDAYLECIQRRATRIG